MFCNKVLPLALVCVPILSCFSQDLPSDCDLNGIVITIITHSSQHDAMVTRKQELWSSNEGLTVLVSSQLNTESQSWTIGPLLPLYSHRLSDHHGSKSWFVFVTEWTELNVERLCSTLATHDVEAELFIGHSLEDREHVIIHHYSPPGSLRYPLIHSGFILSRPALRRATAVINKFDPSFNIDPSYEFSQFLKYLRTPSVEEMLPELPPPPPHTLTLVDEPSLCHTPLSPHCATGFSFRQSCVPRVSLEKVFFAVKTCTNYHSKRLPLVQDTWAADLSDRSIGYYSDSADNQYGTVNIGVPNTERGHCGKLEAILRLFERAHKKKHWLVVADDDTLLSVERLLELLACYDHSLPLLLGELYGFYAHTEGGNSFITGGGGMVLSRAAVESFVRSGRSCPSLDYPDDMFLGSMAGHLHWSIVHSPLFHQSQPASYPEDVLSQHEAVSFHRHAPMDPRTLYWEYLAGGGVSRDRTEL